MQIVRSGPTNEVYIYEWLEKGNVMLKVEIKQDPFSVDVFDEEIISDWDEEDHGYNFIIKKGRTITNPKRSKKTYKKNNSILQCCVSLGE